MLTVEHNDDERCFVIHFQKFAISEDVASEADAELIARNLDEHISRLKNGVQGMVCKIKCAAESLSTEYKVARLERDNQKLRDEITALETQLDSKSQD